MLTRSSSAWQQLSNLKSSFCPPPYPYTASPYVPQFPQYFCYFLCPHFFVSLSMPSLLACKRLSWSELDSCSRLYVSLHHFPLHFVTLLVESTTQKRVPTRQGL